MHVLIPGNEQEESLRAQVLDYCSFLGIKECLSAIYYIILAFSHLNATVIIANHLFRSYVLVRKKQSVKILNCPIENDPLREPRLTQIQQNKLSHWLGFQKLD